MNEFLAAAPSAQVVHGPLACDISLNDLADRPPVAIEPDGVLDTGSHRLRFVATPHVPHNWESGLWFDETTSTLFAGDLFTSIGNGAPFVEHDMIEGAITAELLFQQTSMSPVLEPTLHRLADLGPRTLAVMHGSSYVGDGAPSCSQPGRGLHRRCGPLRPDHQPSLSVRARSCTVARALRDRAVCGAAATAGDLRGPPAGKPGPTGGWPRFGQQSHG